MAREADKAIGVKIVLFPGSLSTFGMTHDCASPSPAPAAALGLPLGPLLSPLPHSLGGDAAPYFAGPLPHFYGGVTAPYFASPLPHSPGGITPPYFASPLPSPAARHGTTACATSGKPGPSTTRYSGARFCGASGREHGGARQELHGCLPAILRSIQGIQWVQGKLSSGCRNVPPEKYIRHKIWDLVRRP